MLQERGREGGCRGANFKGVGSIKRPQLDIDISAQVPTTCICKQHPHSDPGCRGQRVRKVALVSCVIATGKEAKGKEAKGKEAGCEGGDSD